MWSCHRLVLQQGLSSTSRFFRFTYHLLHSQYLTMYPKARTTIFEFPETIEMKKRRLRTEEDRRRHLYDVVSRSRERTQEEDLKELLRRREFDRAARSRES